MSLEFSNPLKRYVRVCYKNVVASNSVQAVFIDNMYFICIFYIYILLKLS